jgi:hypothetical protein
MVSEFESGLTTSNSSPPAVRARDELERRGAGSAPDGRPARATSATSKSATSKVVPIRVGSCFLGAETSRFIPGLSGRPGRADKTDASGAIFTQFSEDDKAVLADRGPIFDRAAHGGYNPA